MSVGEIIFALHCDHRLGQGTQEVVSLKYVPENEAGRGRKWSRTSIVSLSPRLRRHFTSCTAVPVPDDDQRRASTIPIASSGVVVVVVVCIGVLTRQHDAGRSASHDHSHGDMLGGKHDSL